jgi:8-amino-7-oxononanoate synthase
VQPIIYPAVAEKAARLRFFLSSEHSEDDIRATIAALITIRQEAQG